MHRDENWAVDAERIRAFFRSQADVREQEGVFLFGSCRITLLPQTGSAMNKWALARTRILFDGDDQDVRDIHRRFFLRFLSAGG